MTESRRRLPTHPTSEARGPRAGDRPPRYSTEPLPSYRFVPGKNPHPHRDPGGHGITGPAPPARWREEDPLPAAYLYAIDLFNQEYWWECHEALEGLWHAAGHGSPNGRFVHGLIQAAAACLNVERGHESAARRQGRRAVAEVRDRAASVTCLGIDVADFGRALMDWIERPSDAPPTIHLLLAEDAPRAPGDPGREDDR